jgi:hypothetical protein
MVRTAARKPKCALTLMVSSILGPGVADTTKVIRTNSHQVVKLMRNFSKNQGLSLPLAAPIVSMESIHSTSLPAYSCGSFKWQQTASSTTLLSGHGKGEICR